MINIITTFYISKYSSNLDDLRSKELEACLVNNVASPFVEKIHLFVDDDDASNRIKELFNDSEKIIIISVGIKPKYSDFFQYILDNLADKTCMITNSDIFLYEVNDELLKKITENKIAFALTRYEYNMTHPLINKYCGSHDCYIFNSKFITPSIITSHTNYHQNLPGIESHIIKNFCDNGFNVFNPCIQFKIIHLHKTELRKHGEWIGLHKSGDYDYHRKNCWWVPPIILNV